MASDPRDPLASRTPSPTQLVQAAYALEPMPPSLARLAALVSDESTQLRDIVEVVMMDPLLTGSLLRRANSAASASGRPIGTVAEAVVRLGMGQVLALSICSHLGRLAQKAPQSGGHSPLWSHSVAGSIAADVIRGFAREVPPETSTAALMHDIGRLICDRFLPAELSGLVDQARDLDDASRLQAEIAIVGIHHAELGALIAENWKLPATVVAGIRFHHSPEQQPSPVTWAVCLANLLAHEIAPVGATLGASARLPAPAGKKNGNPTVLGGLMARALAALGIPAASYPDLLHRAAHQHGEVKARFR